MLPSNLNPSARLIVGADGMLHDLNLRPAGEFRAPTPVNTGSTACNSGLFHANPQWGNSPAIGLPDMELWCNCDD
jgi:hypothetical protein